MSFLEKVFLGNTVKSWLIGLGIAVGVFVVMQIVKRVVLKYFKKFAATTDNIYDDLLAAVLEKTKLFFVAIVSLYFGSQVLSFSPRVTTIIRSVLVIGLLLQTGYWGSTAIRFWIGDLIERRAEEDKASVTTLSVLGFLARVIFWAALVLLALDNLGFDITAMVAGLGIGGVAVALSVQNILGDLFASLVIILDKPFVIGDFIIVGDMMGTVERIGLKTTRVKSLGGEQLVFSHSDLLKSRIRNYKKMQERRILFTVGVTYQTPLETLKRIPSIIQEIVEKHPQIRFDRSHFARFGGSSLDIETVYFVLSPDYAIYMDTQQDMFLEIMTRFEQEGIEFAYPTQTIHMVGGADEAAAA